MGSKSGGGSNNSTVTQVSQPNPQILADYQNLISRAQGVANAPLQQYGGPMVAGFTPDQMSAFANIDQAQGVANPYINAATQYAGIGAAPVYPNIPQFSAANVQQYQSPYTQNVVNSTLNTINQQNAQQQQQVIGQGIASGNAFGGDRMGVAQAELAGQQDLAKNQTIANLNNQGYSQALGEFNTQQQTSLNAQEGDAWRAANAAYQLGGLGQQAQSSALTGASAQLQSGALQQQLAQEQLNIPYEMFQQQQAYPFQTTNYLAGITEGTGSLTGGTSSTTSPGPSTASQIGGLGLAGLGVVGATGGFGPAGWLTSALGLKRGGRVGYDAGGGIDGQGDNPFAMIALSGAPPNMSSSIVPDTSPHVMGKGPPAAPTPTEAPGLWSQATSPQSLGTLAKIFQGDKKPAFGSDAVPTQALLGKPPIPTDDISPLINVLSPTDLHRGGVAHYDDGGSVNPGADQPVMTGGNPVSQQLYARYAQMPAEQLQRLAVMSPPGTPQGQMIQRALMAKHMAPSSNAPQAPSGLGSAPSGGFASPQGYAPGGTVSSPGYGIALPMLATANDNGTLPIPANDQHVSLPATGTMGLGVPMRGGLGSNGQVNISPVSSYSFNPSQMPAPIVTPLAQNVVSPPPPPAPVAPPPAPVDTTPHTNQDGGGGAQRRGGRIGYDDGGPVADPSAPPQPSASSNMAASPWAALTAAGLGMMSSRSPFPGVAIGEGGLAALNFAQEQRKLGPELALKKAQAENAQAEADLNRLSVNAYSHMQAAARDAGVKSPPQTAGQGQDVGAQSGASSQDGQITAIPSKIGPIGASGTAPSQAVTTGAETGGGGAAPLFNVADLRSQYQAALANPRLSGVAERLLEMMNKAPEGSYMGADGGIYVRPHAAESAATLAGAKSGAEASAAAPYKIAEAYASQAGRPVAVGPEQVVTTGAAALPPEAKAAIDNALGGTGRSSGATSGTPRATTAAAQPSSVGTASTPQDGSPIGTRLTRNPDGSLASPYTPTTKKLADQGAEDYAKARDAYKNAMGLQMRLDMVDHSIDLLNQSGWSSTGQGNQTRVGAAKAFNSLEQTFGLQPSFDPQKIASWEDFNKESTKMGFDLARTLGSREAMMIVQQATSSVPNAENTYMGARLVSSSLRQASQREADFYTFLTDWAGKHNGDTFGADVAFNKQHPPSLYAQKAIVGAVPAPAIDMLRKDPSLAPQFNQKYGPGVAEFVLKGQ